MFTSDDPQPYELEDVKYYIPALSNYRNLEVAGISYQDWSLNVSQFSVYFSKQLPDNFTYGQFSIDGITSPYHCLLNKPINEQPYLGTTYGVFVCDPGLCGATAPILFYNFLENSMPAGNTMTNYWVDSILSFYTEDNNITDTRILKIEPHGKKIYIDKTRKAIAGIRRANIIGAPDHLGFTGAFAIRGNTFYIKPYEGTTTDVFNSRIRNFDSAFCLQNTRNFSFVGFDISEFKTGWNWIGIFGNTDLPTGNKFKYNRLTDVYGGIPVPSTAYNTTIDSNLFNRSIYRPIQIQGKNTTVKNNTLLQHRSHTAIFVTTLSKNTLIDGNLIYSDGAVHGNGMAFYSGAMDITLKNNGIYGRLIGLAINEIGTTSSNEFVVEDNVIMASAGIDLRQNLNRLRFEHNTVIGAGHGRRGYNDLYDWWSLFDHKYRYNVYGSLSGGLMVAGSWNINEWRDPANKDPDWKPIVNAPCSKADPDYGYTAALYDVYYANPTAFSPAILSTGHGNVNGLTYNPNFKDFNMVQTDTIYGVYSYAHNCFINPNDNLPNNYKNFVIHSGTFPTEFKPDSATDGFKNPREITQNIFYCFNRFFNDSDKNEAYNYIFEDSDNYNYKLKDTVYAIPPSTQFISSTFYEAQTGYLNLYSGARTQKVSDYTDSNGDQPGVRWTAHPPANPYNWWLWQENVGFYAPPSES